MTILCVFALVAMMESCVAGSRKREEVLLSTARTPKNARPKIFFQDIEKTKKFDCNFSSDAKMMMMMSSAQLGRNRSSWIQASVMCVYVYMCVYNKIYARLIKWCVISFSLSQSLSYACRASHHVDVHINTKPSPERRRKCVCQTQKRKLFSFNFARDRFSY